MGGDWAPAVFLSVLTITTGGVILLRPVARRLGDFLEVLIQEKRQALEARADLQGLSKRFDLLEERVHFTEGMLGHQAPLPAAAEAAAPQLASGTEANSSR